MFTRAIQTASTFTFPHVGLRRRPDGHVDSLVAGFVLLNDDGWIVTSAHVVEEIIAVGGMSRDDGPQPKDDISVTEHTELWTVPGFQATQPRLVSGRVNPAADIAIGRIEPFDPKVGVGYPVLRDTGLDPVMQGESVCRLGFPFNNVAADFDQAGKRFDVPAGVFPMPRFALDGIVARFNRFVGPQGSGLFIETSTPGLRGQSGGPLLDTLGRVVGIQSRTAHFDLGFDAHYAGAGGEMITERQFLNVGMATHVDELIRMLESDGVSFRRG